MRQAAPSARRHVSARGCRMTRRLSTVTGSLLLLLVAPLAGTAEARTWTVGGSGADFPLIAPAIAAAAAGDDIRVRGGVYREDLLIDKPLTIVGEGRPTLYGTGRGTVVTVAAPDCVLSGFV